MVAVANPLLRLARAYLEVVKDSSSLSTSSKKHLDTIKKLFGEGSDRLTFKVINDKKLPANPKLPIFSLALSELRSLPDQGRRSPLVFGSREREGEGSEGGSHGPGVQQAVVRIEERENGIIIATFFCDVTKLLLLLPVAVLFLSLAQLFTEVF